MDKNRVLVIGKGFLGTQYEKNGFRVLSRKEADLTTQESFNEFVDTYLRSGLYDALVNCVGSADTRWCEKPPNWRDSFYTNATIPQKLSDVCGELGVKLVHISSGCVYDTNSIPNVETQHRSSHCNYVVTKIAGENFCNPDKDIILRPRLFFGDVEDRNNLLTKLPKFDAHLTELNSFTSLQTIVEATEALIDNNQAGFFNVAQEGYGSIKEIVRWLGIEPQRSISGIELQVKCNLALVNNTMDLDKLRQFYQPRDLREELQICWDKLTK